MFGKSETVMTIRTFRGPSAEWPAIFLPTTSFPTIGTTVLS